MNNATEQKNGLSQYISIALISMAVIALETIWTRIFSCEFYYTFAFLILSLTMLGLGLGSLSIRLCKKIDNFNHINYWLIAAVLLSIIAPIVTIQLDINFSMLFVEKIIWLKLFVAIILLIATFFTFGVPIGLLLKQNHENINKLYLFDLVGAALGIIISILMMNIFSTPMAAKLCLLFVLFIPLFDRRKIIKVISFLLFAGILALSFFFNHLYEKKIEERATVIYKHWDAMAKIKVYEFDSLSRGINIDNMANTPVEKFDGNFNVPDSSKPQFAIPVSYLMQKFDSCTFLSLGAGGGQDVLQALYGNAKEIHAVEVNNHINYLMTDGFLNEYSGKIYHNPRVKVVTEDARTYIRQYKNKFDIIYSLSSNTFAALSSGSFAMAENYLFTTDAFKDFYNALSPKGFLMMEHQFYVPRLVSNVIQAFKELGIDDAQKHITVYDLPGMRRKIILLSKQAFDDSTRYNAIVPIIPETQTYIKLLYPAPDSLKNNLVNNIITNGWEKASEKCNFNISPCSDDKPYVAQMGLWKNATKEMPKKLGGFEFNGFPLAKLIIIVILSIIFLLIIPLTIIPFFRKSEEKLKFSGWMYYFLLGLAFMMIEVVLIQRYTLFIGSSTFAFATILFTLLLSSGFGSLYSKKFKNNISFIALLLIILIEIYVFPLLTNQLVNFNMYLRALISVFLLIPLGFFMGMPFPKGTLKVGKLIDWAFAVNGIASVIGSSVVMLVSFEWGFQISMLLALSIYLIAFLLFIKNKTFIK